MTKRNEEWQYMDTLRPPVYVCLRRKADSNGVVPRLKIDGRVDKEEWSHVPWSDAFVDIEGVVKKPTVYPLTRMKMMYDDQHLYIAAELVEKQIWGTILEKNATMYHENDFEVFLNPDGSRHNYYELELNCLNTIWELVLNKPYKDGYSIKNPYNLEHVQTAVYVDGVTNDPQVECTKWSVEVCYRLSELVQFDRLRERPARAGDVWRVNFSRVQYQLMTVLDEETNELQYAKVPDTREDNIVWAPTGVIDIHRPEKWGFVLFSSASDEHEGILELNKAMETFLCEQIAMEQILDTIYYDQRTFHATHENYAESLEELYGKTEAFPRLDLVEEFELSQPVIERQSDPDATPVYTPRGVETSKKRVYSPRLDPDDEEDARKPPLCRFYTVSIKSATQRWIMTQDALLRKIEAS
ncbi:hypothetical protein Poli38472_013145 [Pythium oligandrum]|uniref:Carbohydrate-binding domain-containing protein n=1 Tax=Pythium oligandrum TaxID=41045 RepID=A0A8K1C2G4_PYTOL|nr:hypothetical protein Poli38472_013145 [Pythium oligandrum]|eukprot:TMW55254.1 hypothetical protein Poli38472_013145 [Pythium oligandrum]